MMSKYYESISDKFVQFPKGSVYEHVWTEKRPDGDAGLKDSNGYDMRIKAALLQDEKWFKVVPPPSRPQQRTRYDELNGQAIIEESQDGSNWYRVELPAEPEGWPDDLLMAYDIGEWYDPVWEPEKIAKFRAAIREHERQAMQAAYDRGYNTGWIKSKRSHTPSKLISAAKQLEIIATNLRQTATTQPPAADTTKQGEGE